MDFGGDLSVVDSAAVCQIAGIAGLTGRLKIITTDNVASIFFKRGNLIYASIDTRPKKIGEILIDKGLIDRETLDRSLKECKADGKGKRIGDFLIEKENLKRKDIVSVIQDQIKAVVYSVLRWESGQFVYFDGAEPEDEDILLDIRLDHLLLEGLKRLDESHR